MTPDGRDRRLSDPGPWQSPPIAGGQDASSAGRDEDSPTMGQPGGPGPSKRLAISNALVALYRRCYGRGPTQARTVIDGNVVTCVMRGVFTATERTLLNADKAQTVRALRIEAREAIEDDFRQAVEEITGSPVIGALTAVDVKADMAAETFVLEWQREPETLEHQRRAPADRGSWSRR